MKIRFVSNNQQKIREVCEIAHYTGLEILPYAVKLDILQTDDLQRLVSAKLMAAFNLIGKPVFVEHTGLHIDSLNGFPGGLTQLFWDRLQADRFTHLLGRVEDPTATARTVIGYCDGRKRHFFQGELKGRIARQPAGDRDFEWDCVFIPDGHDCTLAELGDRKHEFSMRRKALDALTAFIREH